jgi:molybdopterin-containing oxidoreductase family iron-sulfur binding subunit
MANLLTRRQFLTGAGALALFGAAGAVGAGGLFEKKVSAATGQSEPASQTNQWCLVFDLRLCDGCKECVGACQKEHYHPKEMQWIKVYEMQGPLGQTYFQPTTCMQCENAPCVKVCPTGASFKTADGVTLVDQEKCIGCRMCMAACPYGARTFNWNDYPAVPSTLPKPTPEFPVPGKKGTVGKCEFCLHNTRVGKLPACVSSCSMRAAWVGDLVSDIAVNPDERVKLSDLLKNNDAFRLKEELNTRPRVYYIAGHAQNYQY